MIEREDTKGDYVIAKVEKTDIASGKKVEEDYYSVFKWHRDNGVDTLWFEMEFNREDEAKKYVKTAQENLEKTPCELVKIMKGKEN